MVRGFVVVAREISSQGGLGFSILNIVRPVKSGFVVHVARRVKEEPARVVVGSRTRRSRETRREQEERS